MRRLCHIIVLFLSVSGFLKLNTSPITALTFTTGTLVNGASYSFVVTGIGPAGNESLPSKVVVLTLPATGTHTVTLTWTAGMNNVTFNVYNQIGVTPPVIVNSVIN